MVMVADGRGFRTVSERLVDLEVTRPYHDLACGSPNDSVGVDPVTIPYQGADLAQGLPRDTFTNLYLRGDTTHIDIHIVTSNGHQVAGWAR